MKSIQITETEKKVFIAVFITGFLAYGFFLTHRFLTYDSIWNIYSDQNMITSGRQFLTYACSISSDYDLPWLNGLLAFLYLAVTSILLVRLFQIRNIITAVLMGGVFTVFPSVTSTFAYTYTIDGYMLAVLLATIAVYVTLHYRWGIVGGFMLLGISIGIYQAYFAYAIVLCILLLVLDLIFEDRFAVVVQRAVRYVLMVTGGYLFYVVTLKLMLLAQGKNLSGYQGSDKVLSAFPVKELWKGIMATYRKFKEFVLYENVLTTTLPMKLAFVILIGIGGAELVWILYRKKIYRCWYRVASLIILAVLTPVCTSIIAVLSPEETYVHLLTRTPWALFFVFALLLGEKTDSEEKICKASCYIGYVAGIILIFEFVVVANIVAFNMHERYEKSYAMCVRIADHLESVPEYRHGMKVAILGGFPSEENYPSTEITKKDLVGYFGVNGDICVASTASYAEFMRHYLFISIQTVSDEEEQALIRSEEYLSMEKFPYEGSIRRIGDVWVVKLN